ncbi:DUF4239 domain-containing protein [Kitasatospora sp. NPDC101183]|uniref:bestrophin-like domain n=1 Tax=Kitasatospora sp. NPDC101183 TaxID=3364100 RepID=UPI0037F68416
MDWVDVMLLVGPLVATIGGLWALQRFVPHPVRVAHNDVAGFIFAVVGVLYAVLLAFVVISVWENVEKAREHTFAEASALAGVYWNSRQMPLPEGGALERLSVQYAHTVIDSEWKLMESHRTDPEVTALMYRIRETAANSDPAPGKQMVVYDHTTQGVEVLAAERRVRLDMIEDSVPPLLWAAIVLGAVVTVGFTFLFGVARLRVHVVMALSLVVLISVSIIAIRALDYPFGGLYRVEPTAFEVFLSNLPAPR